MKPLTFKTIITLLLLAPLLACKEEPPAHPAQGSWLGQMVSNGNVIDIGKIEVGRSSLALRNSKVFRAQLTVKTEQNYIYFNDPQDADFSAKIRLTGNGSAAMEMTGLSGYIELRKEG